MTDGLDFIDGLYDKFSSGYKKYSEGMNEEEEKEFNEFIFDALSFGYYTETLKSLEGFEKIYDQVKIEGLNKNEKDEKDGKDGENKE